MDNLLERLKRNAAVLDLLEAKRNENEMTVEDYARENRILMTELADLEEDMSRDPGTLQPHPVPVKRRRREGAEPR